MLKLLSAAFVALALLVSSPLIAATPAEQSVEMVNKAIKHYQTVGKDKAFADFGDKTNKEWVDGEWYVLVVDANSGLALAYYDPKMINNPAIPDLKDVEGKFIIREQIAAANKSADGGWVSYVWRNPATAKLAKKQSFAKKFDDKVFVVGYYE
ncbi:cache domain-containing protein [Elstera cyanobacteriorum]|uniref:cache domain-containing protein n=1 Tax=Elstera cyanobacteriorum TaxID=2022747 RepID=UPI0023557C6D|nr:cache domain-containing protein [Elstera cyanobacteriorum]MCK6441092.1 cache domain-containing protein [Elstera cyanobacteriorum]